MGAGGNMHGFAIGGGRGATLVAGVGKDRRRGDEIRRAGRKCRPMAGNQRSSVGKDRANMMIEVPSRMDIEGNKQAGWPNNGSKGMGRRYRGEGYHDPWPMTTSQNLSSLS